MPLVRVAGMLFVLLSFVVGPRSVAAQSVFAGLHYTGTGVDLRGASRQVDFGGGYGLHAGVGLSPAWQLVVNYDRNSLTERGTGAPTTTSADVAQTDALLRWFSGPPTSVRLFATGGVTARTVRLGQAFEGLAPTGGGGLLLRARSRVVLSGTALWTFGELTSATQLTDRSGTGFRSTGVRVQAGASLLLFGR